MRKIIDTIAEALNSEEKKFTGGKPERAEKSVWQSAFYNMLFLLSVSILYFLLAHPLLGLFNSNPAVVEAGVLSLRIICAGYVFFA